MKLTDFRVYPVEPVVVHVEPLEPTMGFYAFMDPSAEAALENYGMDPQRLVPVGDVATREMRLVSRWDLQQEVSWAVARRHWRGL